MVAFRYITRELLLVFLAVFILLLLVGLGGRFIGFLQEAAMGRFTATGLWLLLALRVPEFVQVTAPFALFLALLLTFGRLHAEHEFVVLAGAGVGPRRLIGWLLAAIVPIAALVAVLAFVISPQARRLYAELSLEQLRDSELEAIVPGTFHVYSGGRRVTYTDAVDRQQKRLRGVFMAERRGPASVTVWAQSGRQHRFPATGNRFLELHKGVRYEGSPGESGYRVVEFQRLGQRLTREPAPRLTDVRMAATTALLNGDRGAAAELQWRLALPVMTVIAGLLAVGVSRAAVRADRFARLLPGVGLFIGYYLLLVFVRDGLAKGVVAALPGLWAVHGGAAVLAVWLLRRGATAT